MRAPSLASLGLAGVAFTLGACSAGPQPIAYGSDACGFCRMTIADSRFGAELVSREGRMHKFDSIECLAGFYLGVRQAGEPRALLVTDIARPGALVSVDSVQFVKGALLHSPMGMGLAAVSTDSAAAMVARAGGTVMSWSEVVALVERERGRGATQTVEPEHAHAP